MEDSRPRIPNQYRRAFDWRLSYGKRDSIDTNATAMTRLASSDFPDILEDFLETSRKRKTNWTALARLQTHMIGELLSQEGAVRHYQAKLKDLKESRTPTTDDAEFTRELKFIDQELFLYRLYANAVRGIGDGIAWRTLGYDRAVTRLMSEQATKQWLTSDGLEQELREWSMRFERGDGIAIFNALTNCLAVGDVTVVRPDDSVEIIEVKSSNTKSRRKIRQKHKMSEVVHTYTWDAENRIASIDGKTNTYDALDRVVESGGTTQILYGPTGKLAVQNGQMNARVYLNLPKGAMVVYGNFVNPLAYYHPDFMGNGILATSFTQSKVFDRFFAPFGEVYNSQGIPATASFTGKTQDLDSNLYDFEFREQSPVQGRWLNPDPSSMGASNLGDPQTLNRYSYVRNSAMELTDPRGLHGEIWASHFVFGGGVFTGNRAPNELPGWYIAAVQQGWQNLQAAEAAAKKAAEEAQKPLTPQQIQKQFYKQHGNAFNAAVNKVFGKDASKVPEQTLANAPKLDTTKSRADLSAMGKGEPTEARNRGNSDTYQAKDGTIFIPTETVASGKMNVISGDYAHELANLLDFQINGFRNAEKNYGNSDPNTNFGDRDTGMNVEVTMFGSPQYP